MENKENMKHKHLPALTVVLIIALGALSFGTVRDMVGAAGGTFVGGAIEGTSKTQTLTAVTAETQINLAEISGSASTTDRCAFRSVVQEELDPEYNQERDNHTITGCIEKVHTEYTRCYAELMQFDGRKVVLATDTLERGNFFCSFLSQALTTNSPISVSGPIPFEIEKPWIESANGVITYTSDVSMYIRQFDILKIR